MIFVDRSAAGRMLAERLADDPLVRDSDRTVTLAIPRGGLPVGVEVAKRLGTQFDVAVASELQAPHDPDVGFGAVAADGHLEVDQSVVRRLGLTDEEVTTEVERRREAVGRRIALYRKSLVPADVDGALAIVVDDGVASGATARHACRLARRLGAAQVVLGVPVAPADAAERMSGEADRIVVLTTPPEFLSVGQAYQEFPRLGDDELLPLIESVAAHGAA